MHFEAPGWILAALPLAFAAWRWKKLRLLSPLRAACTGLLLLALMRPTRHSLSKELELWALMDRSLSAAPQEERQGEEILTLLRHSKPRDARLRVADFAAEMRERESTRLELDPHESRLADGIRWVLQHRSPTHPSRILLVTDGLSTQPLTGVAEEARAAGVPIDIRWLLDPPAPDAQVDLLEAPTRSAPGEGFLLQARLSANFDGQVPYQLLRDGVPIDSGSLTLSRGRAAARFADVLRTPGTHRYELLLQPPNDSRPENNRAETWILCEGKGNILLLSPFPSDPLLPVLESGGFTVRHLRDPAPLQPGILAAARLVILHNFPAESLPQAFRKALPFYVQEQGGGLLMLGGKNSFGSGGYYQSEIDPLLPVSLDLQRREKKLLAAVAILMDRSGSMGSSPSGTQSAGLTKMDLANEGAAASLELLGDQDLAAVYAVDTKAHEILPLSPLGKNRAPLLDSVRRVRSAGGGINIHEALEAGCEALSKIRVGTRHIILFADARDSRQHPGDYRQIVQAAVAEGITVSVIGMGSENDSDAELLKEIAQLGKGRALFQSNAFGIPALFAQETMLVSRPAFAEEPASLQPTAGWREISAAPLRWLPEVDAFNLTLPRPGATLAAHTGQEDPTPLVAFWQKGAGRTAAIGFPLAGPFSEKARAWPDSPKLLTSLAQWCAAPEHPPGADVRTQVRGTTLQVDFFYEPSWEETLAATPPLLRTQDQHSEQVTATPWERMAPGHFRSQIRVAPGSLLQGVVHAGKSVFPFGPILIPTNAEWMKSPASLAETRALVTATGGSERVDLSECWAPTESSRRDHALQPGILALLLVLVLMEALHTRAGWHENHTG